ncbi:MAG: Gfo/Idh/MocA family oxidoreductase [Planctomycetaceae bacterium]|nr:Gfo/Idh/MocA family oxidoreductase [Planctomycetaceae bacterium]
MSQNFSRRDFLKSTTAGAAAISTGLWTGTASAKVRSVNEKLNIACVGTANRALADINGVATENLVAFVDVDSTFLGRIGERYPEARKYSDYREMLDAEKGKIDAVVVATTDHHHAPATIRAIRQGLHVYCEKPLTHTVQEARIIAEAAKEHGVATQMGTQIHAGDNYRRVVEIIQSGAIGDVNEVHVWVGKGWGGGDRPEEAQEPPANLDWDLWLGPAPKRPFHKGTYHPGQWRRWWDFGQGTLGDMGCHYMDLPFWALKLRHPTSAEATGPEVHPETCPLGLSVTYEFPARGDLVPVNFTWYDGNMIPKEIHGQRVPANGVMFVGSEGMMFADYSKYRLFPTDKFSNFEPPAKTIAPSIGHHQEWIKACKEGSPTLCNFDYSGALTETVLLGNVAYRTGKKLDWDAQSLVATNAPEAQKYIQKEYTKGWEVV